MVSSGSAVTNYQSFGGDKGSWVYNRIIIVRCDNVITDEKQDKNLVEHLLEEKEYIVSLAIKGLKQVIDNGYKYNIPDSCKSLNEDYQIENHSFLAFMKECVIDRPNPDKIEDSCTTAKFYKVYEAWCKDNNNGYKESKREVNKILEELGKGEKKKTNGGNTYYKTITLSKEAKKDYEKIYNPDDEEDKPKNEFENNNDDIDIKELFGGIEPMDFSNIDIPDFDEFDINNLHSDDLRPSDEVLAEAGILDVNISNDVVDNNNENV